MALPVARFFGGLTVLGYVAAATAQQPAEVAVAERIRGKYPRTEFRSISKTPVAGVYEVVMGQNVAYVDESGRYFLFGRMFDMERQKDLTEARVQEASTVDFKAFPLDSAIKSVRGTGKRTLVVFSDPDCPFCKRLEQSLEQLNDVTIYTFLYPLAQIHPDARRKAVAVWCSPNREEAWRALMLRNVLPAAANCDNPVDATVALGQRLGVNGTPTMFSSDGRRIAGAIPLDAINAFIDQPKVAGGRP